LTVADLSSLESAYLIRMVLSLAEVQSPKASASSGWVPFITARVGMLRRSEYDENISVSSMPRCSLRMARLAVWKLAREKATPFS
jgi:hypothetical protein